ncbi:hypothetical protein JCGZ_01887 [Jatropha curcas]|uniref:Uncharacterized protein n=1 Tax=Jatropha curcas TaxID=180498 RepID=A0A067LDD1_JATCU|nr:hypothetical protein JCGZ_01887 [Jatropha curcas]
MSFHLFLFFSLLLKLASSSAAAIITTLPGYNASLPFTLETGYVGVDDEKQQLFYYFVESQRDPSADPILFWISGGPGCSSLWAFFYENGPLNFNLSYTFDGTLPQLIDNEYAWTKFMNILYLDGPAGTGFSYSITQEGYNTSNFKFAANLNEFIHKWLESHDQFSTNAIYISGDGFSGNPIPIALEEILNDNEAGVKPYVNMGGYVLVSPGTDFDLDFNSRIPYANRMGLISDEIFEVAKEYCNGSYINPTSDECKLTMEIINQLISNINTAHILEPACRYAILPSSKSNSLLHRSLQEDFTTFLDQPADAPPMPWCRKYNHEVANVWVNFEGVKEALQVREGTQPSEWQLCNTTVDNQTYYKDDIKSVVSYHKNLSNTNIRGIILSGSHDMDIPNISTQQWIWSLGLSLVESWRVWSVDNETAGYTRKFENGDFSLTYATVKGAGHFTPEYKPKECYYMVYNWTSGLPL